MVLYLMDSTDRVHTDGWSVGQNVLVIIFQNKNDKKHGDPGEKPKPTHSYKECL